MEKIILRPPYPSTGQADEILDIFRRISPKKIDSKFIAENKIATAPNASSVVNFVRWMGITDAENNVIPDIANKLRLVGEQRNDSIQELIKKSYKDILGNINLQEARREDLINFFIHNYKYGIAPAKSASILLLHLCEKYNIPVSEELKKKTHTHVSPIKKIEKRSEKKQSHEDTFNKKGKLDHSPYEVKIPEGAFRISIEGNGLNKNLVANNEEELQKAYEKFKDFINAAKHLFPENNLEEEDKAEEKES